MICKGTLQHCCFCDLLRNVSALLFGNLLTLFNRNMLWDLPWDFCAFLLAYFVADLLWNLLRHFLALLSWNLLRHFSTGTCFGICLGNILTFLSRNILTLLFGYVMTALLWNLLANRLGTP